jgi:hypothetical protein
MRALRHLALVALVAVGLSGCVVRERLYVRGPRACGVWVAPHYDGWGRWHPGHWSC